MTEAETATTEAAAACVRDLLATWTDGYALAIAHRSGEMRTARLAQAGAVAARSLQKLCPGMAETEIDDAVSRLGAALHRRITEIEATSSGEGHA
jgi:hypothetical protein